jgi:hypothetical protein
MAEGWNQFMALTRERQAVLDAELQYIHRYFTSLASEINAAAPLAEKRGSTYYAAVEVAGQVDHLRHLLAGRKELQRAEMERGDRKGSRIKHQTSSAKRDS